MKIALIQMSAQPKKEDSLAIARDYIKKAASEKADIAVLPEMFNCPYQTDNFPIYAEFEGGECWQELSKYAAENKIYLVGGSMPEKDDKGRVYNTCYVFDREGRQIGKHRKAHLFDIAVKGGQCFKESDTLTAGNRVSVFDTEFGRFGLEICYDIRFPEFARLTAMEGAKMIFVPAAFNMTTGPAHWELPSVQEHWIIRCSWLAAPRQDKVKAISPMEIPLLHPHGAKFLGSWMKKKAC